MKNYRSWIPNVAEQHVKSTYRSNGAKHQVEYLLEGKIVGYRSFDDEGIMQSEVPIQNGKTHGTMYYFDNVSDGKLRVTFAERYRNGLAHGRRRQWSEEGTLVGTGVFDRGTGLDSWWHRGLADKAQFYLSEARFFKDGKFHGFGWLLNEDQNSVHEEKHFCEDMQHGIQRQWNGSLYGTGPERLRRGFPKYWVSNKKVSKRQYLSACRKDPTLPPFREIDNRPQRDFPPEVLKAIQNPTQL